MKATTASINITGSLFGAYVSKFTQAAVHAPNASKPLMVKNTLLRNRELLRLKSGAIMVTTDDVFYAVLATLYLRIAAIIH